MSDDQISPEADRRSELEQLDSWLERPMILLSFAWLLLVLIELIWGSSDLLEVFGTAIWIVFLIEFAVRLLLAPDKISFLRGNWLTVIALVVPAFRMLRAFRALRVARAARGFRLVRVIGTANRGMSALRSSMQRRGLGYVLGVTSIVVLVGAGGMLAFEPAGEVEGGFTGYGDALWWTAMLLTSIGSEFWPDSAEGRVLCFLLSTYGLAVFGYITASFASFFVGQDAARDDTGIARASEIAQLRREIAALRTDLAQRG